MASGGVGLGATLGGATVGGATLGDAEGASGLAEGTGDGAMSTARRAVRTSVASNETARTDLDIVGSACVDGEESVVEE